MDAAFPVASRIIQLLTLVISSYGCKTVTIYDSPANDKPAERILCDNSAGVSTLYRHTTTRKSDIYEDCNQPVTN